MTREEAVLELDYRLDLAEDLKAEAARRDSNAFAEYVIEDDITGKPIKQSKMHRELTTFLDEILVSSTKKYDPKRRGLTKIPREFGKTTQIISKCLRGLGENDRLRIAYVAATEKDATKKTSAMKRYVEKSEKLRLVYPEMFPSTEKWSDGEFRLGNSRLMGVDANVTAYGVMSSGTGARADWLILDDVVDSKQYQHPTEREKAYEQIVNKFINFLGVRGRMISIYTPWHEHDANARLEASGAFEVFSRPVGPNFESPWPERWDKRALKERKKTIGTWAYNRNYRLIPISEEDRVVKLHWIQFWEEIPHKGKIFMAVDPAISKKTTADYTGIVVGTKMPDGSLLIIDVVREKLDFPQLLSTIKLMAEKHNPQAIVIEEVSFQKAIRPALLNDSSLPLCGIKPDKDKMSRFKAFSLQVENGKVRLKGKRKSGVMGVDPKQQHLFDEMAMFPVGTHDDLFDAIEMCWKVSEKYGAVSLAKGGVYGTSKRSIDKVNMFG